MHFIRGSFLLFLFFVFAIVAIAQPKPKVDAFVMHLHQNAVLVDMHNGIISSELIDGYDIGKKQDRDSCNFDLPRARAGGLDAQVFSIWCGPQYSKGQAFRFANREIDSVYAFIKHHPDQVTLVRNTSELKRAVIQQKFAAMIGVNGGHMIEDRLDYIDSLAKRGMCYLTLTCNSSTDWATSAVDESRKVSPFTEKGLSYFGKRVIERLNDLGVIVDLSDPGEKTFYDVLEVTRKPVIASHSCAYALNPNPHNLTDDQLKALAKNDGVVFVDFYSGFLDSTYAKKEKVFIAAHRSDLDSLTKVYNDKDLAMVHLNALHKEEADKLRPPLSLLIRHIDYMVKLIGADHVGIGSGFDGTESFPLGMDDVTDYPKITDELLKLHYDRKDIDKILGANFMRVLKVNTGD